MPLTTCPDCSAQVSDAAAACIHCGYPLRQAAPAPPPVPAAIQPKPMAGIVAALVIGGLTLFGALQPVDAKLHEQFGSAATLPKSLYAVGCLALIVGALLSLAGHSYGNRVVRVTSMLMLPALVVLMLVLRRMLEETGAGNSPDYVAILVTVLGVISALPWLLYLYLFRKSKYP